MTFLNPLVRSDFVPEDHGLSVWSFDAAMAQLAVVLPTAGRLTTIRLKVPRPVLVTDLCILIGTAGATLTANQNFAMLFDESGNRVGLTADQSTAWTGTGFVAMALTTPVQVNGPTCTVGMYYNGTTSPALRTPGSATASGNAGLATASSRFGLSTTGLTTTPPSTVGTIAAQAASYWVGLR